MVQYLRLLADAEGESHFSEEPFMLEVIGDHGDREILGSSLNPASHYAVRVVPSGWERDWGPAPHPILAIYLSGEGQIEASDGDVRDITAGTVLLAEDTTGPGHRVKVTSQEPVTVIQIHLPG